MGTSLTTLNRDLVQLEVGLRQLDAVREDKEKIVSFEFETKVSYRLMRCSVAVGRAKAAFDLADRAIAKATGFFEGMQVVIRNAEGVEIGVNEVNAKIRDDYQHRRAALLDQEAELEGALLVTLDQLFMRPAEDKKPARRNPIPQSVIARLAPIILPIIVEEGET